MCIEKTESYRYKGALYDTELQAIEAALTDIGNDIKKNHINHPYDGIMANREKMLPLLIRHAALINNTADKAVEMKLTLGELNAGGHARNCSARATGYASDCTCQPGTGRNSRTFAPVQDGMASLKGDGA